MLALWLEDRRLRLREDVPAPEPAAGQALVRVLRAGICNTDVELVRGYYPYTGVLGHEFVGLELPGLRIHPHAECLAPNCRSPGVSQGPAK